MGFLNDTMDNLAALFTFLLCVFYSLLSLLFVFVVASWSMMAAVYDDDDDDDEDYVETGHNSGALVALCHFFLIWFIAVFGPEEPFPRTLQRLTIDVVVVSLILAVVVWIMAWLF